MPYEPFERVPLGRPGLEVTRLGFGGASIGGLFRPSTTRRRRHGPPRLGDRGPLPSTSRRCTATGPRNDGWARRSPGSRATRSCSSTKVGRLWSATASDPGRRRHRPPGARRSRGRLLRRHGRRASSSTTAPTASDARSRRASNGSVSTASTSPSSTTRTTTGEAAIDGRLAGARPAPRGGRGPRRSAPA